MNLVVDRVVIEGRHGLAVRVRQAKELTRIDERFLEYCRNSERREPRTWIFGCRAHDHGNVGELRIAAERIAELEAIDSRHEQVNHGETRPQAGRDLIECVLPIRCRFDLEAVRPEESRQGVTNISIVLDDQNGASGTR